MLLRPRFHRTPWLSLAAILLAPVVVMWAFNRVEHRSTAARGLTNLWEHGSLKPKPGSGSTCCSVRILESPEGLMKILRAMQNLQDNLIEQAPRVALFGDRADPEAIGWIKADTRGDWPSDTFAIYRVEVRTFTPRAFWAPTLNQHEPRLTTDFDTETNRYHSIPSYHLERIAQSTPGLTRAERAAIASGQEVFIALNFEGLAINAATMIALLAFPVSTARTARWSLLRLQSRRMNHSHCPQCGYPAEGLPSPTCPECGLVRC